MKLVARTMTPDTPGDHRLRWEMVHEGVTWFTEVHKLDLRSWRDEVVLPADRVIWEMSLSPDGTRLGMVTTDNIEK